MYFETLSFSGILLIGFESLDDDDVGKSKLDLVINFFSFTRPFSM